jgi:hypothetical protein
VNGHPPGGHGIYTAGVRARHKRDYYCEDPWVWPAFFRDVRLPAGVYDPFCGIGRVLDAARWAGYREVFGSDIVRRAGLDRAHSFYRCSYQDRIENPFGFLAHSVVSNPAYSWVDDLLVDVCAIRRPAALFLPITYLAGKAELLARTPLQRVLVCKPRPSCPPPAASKRTGGKMDYAIFYFVPGTEPGTARLGWLRRDP